MRKVYEKHTWKEVAKGHFLPDLENGGGVFFTEHNPSTGGPSIAVFGRNTFDCLTGLKPVVSGSQLGNYRAALRLGRGQKAVLQSYSAGGMSTGYKIDFPLVVY